MRPNFERIAEVMWNQLKQTIPRLISGASLGSTELFGETMPKGSMPPYRKRLIEAGVIRNDHLGRGIIIEDEDKALAFLESPMTVAEILWPTEAKELKAHLEKVAELKMRKAPLTQPLIPRAMATLLTLESLMKPVSEAPVIPSKELFEPSAAMHALRMMSPTKESFVVARPLPVPVVVPTAPEVKVPEVKPPEAKVVTPAPSLLQNEDLAELEAAKLKLMHATAENMVYIRDRLDGLIKRSQQPAPPAQAVIQKEVQVVKVPVLPTEIPVVLTVVNAEHIDVRFDAMEKQLTEILTIIRTLM